MSVLKEQVEAILIGTTVGGALTTSKARGCTAAYVSPGIIDVTLEQALDDLEMSFQVTPRTVARAAAVVSTSDTVKRVTFHDLAIPTVAESAFEIRVSRVAYGDQ